MLADTWTAGDTWAGGDVWNTAGRVVAGGGVAAWDGVTRFQGGTHGVAIVPLGFAQYYTWSTAYFNSQITSTTLSNWLAAGVDCIRLTMDPTPLCKALAASTSTSAIVATITGAVTTLVNAGFKVILDSHVETAGTDYVNGGSIVWYDTAIIAAYPSGSLWTTYVQAMQMFAQIAAGWSTSQVALEVFNEPPMNNGVTTWNTQAVALCTAIRTVNKITTLLVGGTEYADIQGILDLTPSAFPDTNMGWVIHDYTPRAFALGTVSADVAHVNGTSGGTGAAAPNPIYYPPIASDQTAQTATATAAGMASGSSEATQLGQYFTVPFNDAWTLNQYTVDNTLGSGLNCVETWRTSHNVLATQMFITEYGSRGGANPTMAINPVSRAAWTQGKRRVFDQLNYRRFLWDGAPALSNDTFQSTNQDSTGNFLGEIAVAQGLSCRETYQSQTTALLNRMTVTPSAKHQDLINVCIKMLVNQGLWALCDGIYALAADAAADALLNWKGTAYPLTVTGSPTFTAGAGYVSSSSAYLSCPTGTLGTGTLWTENSAHLGIWQNTASTVDAPLVADGAGVNGIGGGQYSFITGLNSSSGRNYGSESPVITFPSHLCASRAAAASYPTYVNGSLTATVTATSQATTGTTLSTFGGNTGQLSMWHFGSAITQAQMRDMATICRIYMQGL